MYMDEDRQPVITKCTVLASKRVTFTHRHKYQLVLVQLFMRHRYVMRTFYFCMCYFCGKKYAKIKPNNCDEVINVGGTLNLLKYSYLDNINYIKFKQQRSD